LYSDNKEKGIVQPRFAVGSQLQNAYVNLFAHILDCNRASVRSEFANLPALAHRERERNNGA